ncbi:MAG: hypothetical protein JWQ13_4046 [Ramlibacter sp.]|jgi:hypothetical protein|nr:hypothetical protein [Ramlibacter sp.]
MRLPLSLATLALLAGCSTASAVREAWNWDPTAPRERTRIVLAPEQLASLSNRLADLRIQRNDIRSRISAEPDVGVRLRLYEDLHRVGMQLSPLERQLAGAAS